MAKYRYRAKNADGKTVRGVLDVQDEQALAQELKQQDLFLIKCSRCLQGKREQHLKAKQLTEFCNQLSNLLASGVSLVRALDIITREDGISPFELEIYTRVMAEVKKGVSLSEAMEAQECFPDLMLGMIRSGESNGNLDVVTKRLAIHYKREDQLNGQVRSAMTYPLVLLVLLILILIVLLTFVIPQFEELFAQMESLPLPTVILLGVSDFIKAYWYILIPVLAVLAIILRLLLRFPKLRRKMDYCKVHLPVAGKLNRVIYSARFARTLSSLYASGMPIVGALKMAGETIGNRYVEEQFDQVVVMVRCGTPLSEALSGVDGLQKKLASTIYVGEESGRLDNMLDSIADVMEAEAQEATKRLVTLVEPVMIIIMAFVVAFVLVAVMLPIYQSYSEIEKMG